jgi:hypothetical protein
MDLPIVEPRDPRDRFAKPPFSQKKQTGSGSTGKLDLPADYGEASYTRHGRLEGRAPSSPARTAELAALLLYVSPRKVLTSYSPFEKVTQTRRRMPRTL